MPPPSIDESLRSLPLPSSKHCFSKYRPENDKKSIRSQRCFICVQIYQNFSLVPLGPASSIVRSDVANMSDNTTLLKDTNESFALDPVSLKKS